MTIIRSSDHQLQIPRSSLKRILKQLLSLYPYKQQALQALAAVDRQNGLEFANHVLTQPCGAAKCLDRIIYSDECLFRTNGYVNK